MNYFNFTPFELIEITLSYLTKDDLLSFLAFYDIKDNLNWNIIYYLHFGRYKNNINYKKYINWLSLEKLREEFYLKKELENTTELYLNSSGLTEIPEEIVELINLRILNSSNNLLTYLPEEIENLTNLQFLNLSHNNLTELPKEIGNLIKLKYLYLNHNKLVSIPKEIGHLNQLEVLDLNDNNLTGLPREIGNLSNLQYLNLSNNKFTQLELTEIRSLLPNTRIYL